MRAADLVYQVADYQAAVTALRAGDVTEIDELEIPHGPCTTFRLEGGQRYATHQLTCRTPTSTSPAAWSSSPPRSPP